MAITLTQIRAFLAVKSTGSVHAAAGQLLVSQPSVSAAIASLAREVGAALFERHGRGVRLTESGEAFAPYAAQVLGLLDQGRNAALEAAHPENSRVRLVAVNTAGEYLAPPLIQAYRQLHPGVAILLEVGNRATVFERLESRRADIGIGGRPAGRALAGFPFVGNELIVVGREVPADLARTPWLLREDGSGTRLATERLLADLDLGSAGAGAPELLTLGSNGAIKQGLVVGLGVTLISRFAVASELRSGTLCEIGVAGTPLTRPWHVLFPSAGPRRPAVRAFGEFLRSARGRAVIQKLL
ncbi:LysR substrate-binding domain-containing protein [Trebonia sp.]|uniref:LysR substrate-binding domain-containing protein n=1 Tax=Trebonia sp. TaxID=2767075 RepID=UPI002637F6A0|nr:LysR substrate-binding domain-containing protein [Trebonia sp.]